MFERTNFIIVIYFVFQALSGELKKLLICYLVRTRRLFLSPQLCPFSADHFTF